MNKALFLDRDGVINVDTNYVHRIEDFVFTDQIFELCREYLKKGFIIIVITNQAGIARKYYSEEDFNILTDWMILEFEKRDIKIEHVYFCPHHPLITGDCNCRKPNPGMILEAAAEYDIDLSSSVLIGDKETDLEAGRRAGVARNMLITDV